MKPDWSHLQKPYLFFAGVLLVHLLFLAGTIFINPAPLNDSDDYLNASRNLYMQGVLYCGDLSEPIHEEQFTRRPPLYPLLLGSAILSGSSIPVFLLQLLFSLSTIFLIRRIFFNKHTDPGNQLFLYILAGILLMATPAQFIYTNRLMAEIPFQLLLVLMVWCVQKVFHDKKEYLKSQHRILKSDRYIWLFNLFLILGMGTKPVLFPFSILIMAISVFLFIRTRRLAFILAMSLPVLWITLYSVWNYNRTGSPQYSSIQTANMVNYNLRYFVMEEEGSEAASKEVDKLYAVCGNQMDYRDKNKCLGQGVRDIIIDQPLKYGVFHLKGSLRYFLDPGRFDLVTFFNIEGPGKPGLLHQLNNDGISGAIGYLKQQGWGLVSILGLIFLFKLVKVTGFLLYIFKEREQLQLRIFLAILVGYLAIVTGPLGASRFFLPVELLIIGAAVMGWNSILAKSKSTR